MIGLTNKLRSLKVGESLFLPIHSTDPYTVAKRIGIVVKGRKENGGMWIVRMAGESHANRTNHASREDQQE
jgi:hypothetical protein